MKQSSCARWCIFSNSAAVGPSPEYSASGRRTARVTADFPSLVFPHRPGGTINVAIDGIAALLCDKQKEQHVAAGKCRNKRLLGINGRSDRQRQWNDVRGRGCRHRDTFVELPRVGTAVPVGGEIGVTALPTNRCSMFAHEAYASRAPFVAGRSGVTSITLPSPCTQPVTKHSDRNGPIRFGGKLTTPSTCLPTNVSGL